MRGYAGRLGRLGSTKTRTVRVKLGGAQDLGKTQNAGYIQLNSFLFGPVAFEPLTTR